MEWTLGITDKQPKRWRRLEPRWEDEQLTATSKNTYHQLMNKLCETALAKRREHGDYGIDSHLWHLEICSERTLLEAPMRRERRMHMESPSSSSDEDDSEDDEDETKYRGIVKVAPRHHIEQIQEMDFDDEEYTYVASSSKLTRQVLPTGHIIKLTYDFGTTTTLYLKVLSARPKAVGSLLQYFEAESDVPGQWKDLQAVPAYTWPKEKQIDAHFPNYSKAFMGSYVPVVVSLQDGDEEDLLPQNPIGSATLGLTARIRSEKDTIFATMEDASCGQDLMFAGMSFEDLNEFFTVAEQAWTPRSNSDTDEENLRQYRYNGVSRYLFPKSKEADEPYQVVSKAAEDNPWAAYSAKKLFYRLKEDDDDDEVPSNSFDFATAFPKTHAHFTSGKFRWIQYKKGVLRVLVGRGVGQDHRDYESGQVLRTWKQQFGSFHELLCAVEASWIYCGKPLTADMELSYLDADLGPSHPGPKEPPCWGKATDAVVISKRNDRKKFVTALAIVAEPHQKGRTVLYSGHNDGTLTKWSLDDNTLLWSKAVYHDATADEDVGAHNVSYGIKSTFGVAGIAVRWHETKGYHRIYTWTDAYDGYPDAEWADRSPSKVKCWCGDDGKFLQEYVCDIGDDEDSKPACPSIATVVFCRLQINNRWRRSMVVGLHCCTNGVLNWDTDYSDFDLEAAQEQGEGSILPFHEHSGEVMESWRGHQDIIQAMAVIPDKYLLSYSMRWGHGLPDAMILWDLTDPGVPLCRHELWDPSRSLLKQNQSRISGVAGISVSGTELLISCEYGDRIAVVTVEDEDGDPSLQLHGYGNIGNRYYEGENFHGRMAMNGKHAVMANEGNKTAWLFQIGDISHHDKLDKREGNPRLFRDYESGEEDDDEGGSEWTYSGREMAIGKVTFPEFGGEPPKRKKQRSIFGPVSSDDNDFGSCLGDGWGEGGPIALALCGKWLVAGFINGTLVRAPLLAQLDERAPANKEANTLASYSPLPSDEWHHPVLDSTEAEQSDDEEDRRGDCCIQ